MEDLLGTIQELAVTYGLKILGAVAIITIGWWLAGIISRFVRRILSKTQVNETLVGFVANLAYYGLFILALIAALENVGVQTASFVALIGGAGLAIGLALEGALSNFAAGVMILIFRPFKVGDRVEVAGSFGEVQEILLFSTILLTLDKKTVIIPNAQITGSTITNYSMQGYIRIDMVFGIGYEDDILKAKRILLDILHNQEYVLADPAPEVSVLELADSSVNFAVRPYVDVDHYWGVYFAVTEQVKLRFDAEGISIPFPQRDVHLYQSAN